jgi:hypothetical protein
MNVLLFLKRSPRLIKLVPARQSLGAISNPTLHQIHPLESALASLSVPLRHRGMRGAAKLKSSVHAGKKL